MTGSVTLAAAFGGGLISFLSPCVLPIVPAYLSIVTGLEVGEIREGRGHLARIARDTGLFVAGFSLVFILLGLSATTIGQALFDNHRLITRISGLVVLAMALFVLGSLILRSPWLYQERRFHPDLSRFGPLAAPVAGVAFGFGWTPCIGPVLTSILAIAATEHGVGRGGLLLAVYSARLGVPFMATGLAFFRVTGALGWVKRHFVGVTVTSAISLAIFGVILALDRLVWVTPGVVNFFASWCTACDAELPGFAKVSAELDGRVAFVGVNANETGDAMYMPRRHGITHWPLASDTGGRNHSGLHEALGGRGMPITAFYDAEGHLLHVDLGALPEPALRRRLDDLYGTHTVAT